VNGTETLPGEVRAAIQRGETARLDFVDALRGWAILAVLAVHTTKFITGALPPWLQHLTAHGARGVQLFYVISAFTLFLSLSRREGRELKPDRNFFIRRFFRIAPMFYIALVAFLVRDGLGPRYWLGDAPGLKGWNILANICFVNGLNPYTLNSVIPIGWSVAVEVMFYLTLPFLFSRVRDMRAALWLTLISLLGSLALDQMLIRLHPIGSDELWRNYLFMWLPSQAPVFCLGIVLYFCWQKLENQEWREMGSWFLCAAIALAGMACYGGYAFLPGHFVFGIAFVLLAMGLAIRPVALFVNPITRTIGKVSYSLYLTHLLALPYCAKAMNMFYNRSGRYWPGATEYFLLWILAVPVCFAAAMACYAAIEKPAIEFGRRRIQRLEAQ
jgi:peptidoglycan/LPS O-acetylase OafA/YrhL